MPSSFNILKNIKIAVEVIPSAERMERFKSSIEARIHCMRALTGATISTIDLHAIAHSDTREDAIISVINEMLEGNYIFRETVHPDAHYSEVDYSKIHAIESHDIEEHFDLFHKHFDLLKFSLPQEMKPKDHATTVNLLLAGKEEDGHK